MPSLPVYKHDTTFRLIEYLTNGEYNGDYKDLVGGRKEGQIDLVRLYFVIPGSSSEEKQIKKSFNGEMRISSIREITHKGPSEYYPSSLSGKTVKLFDKLKTEFDKLEEKSESTINALKGYIDATNTEYDFPRDKPFYVADALIDFQAELRSDQESARKKEKEEEDKKKLAG